MLDVLNIKLESVAAIASSQKDVNMTAISKQKSSLLKQFSETRTMTLNLVQTLEKDDFIVQTASFMSPPKWHLGHVSWLFEVVLS